LSEIAGLAVGPEYNGKFVTLFNVVMTSINRMVPPSTDMAAAYATSDDDDQQLISNLALFLTNYLHHHLRLIENPENQELLINAHLYLIKISTVDDREVFKICLEYWAKVSWPGRIYAIQLTRSSFPSYTKRSRTFQSTISTL
jgi:exportin-1